jgi:hypothetical protein
MHAAQCGQPRRRSRILPRCARQNRLAREPGLALRAWGAATNRVGGFHRASITSLRAPDVAALARYKEVGVLTWIEYELICSR